MKATRLAGMMVFLLGWFGCSFERQEERLSGVTATGNTGKILGRVSVDSKRVVVGARQIAARTLEPVDSTWTVKVFLWMRGQALPRDSQLVLPGGSYEFKGLPAATFLILALSDQSGWYSDTVRVVLEAGQQRDAPMVVAPPAMSYRSGMTWGKRKRDSALGIDFLSCHAVAENGRTQSCSSTAGDQPCTAILPLLCVRKSGVVRPAYTVDYPLNGGMALAYYGGWLEGDAALAPRISGTSLRSKLGGDSVCQVALGAGWQMAEFHDGRYVDGMDSTKTYGASWSQATTTEGGWGFYARSGNLPMYSRFWVSIDDQKANCWDL